MGARWLVSVSSWVDRETGTETENMSLRDAGTVGQGRVRAAIYGTVGDGMGGRQYSTCGDAR